jgi:hypothetical protein
MHVIPHQDVGVEGAHVPAAIAFEPTQIGAVIGLIMEAGDPLVTADDDMKEGTGKVEPGFASHAASLGFVWQ